MSKKIAPLWREAHFSSQHVQNTSAPYHFLEVPMSKNGTTSCIRSWDMECKAGVDT